MYLAALGLVVGSAFFHAAWNAALRHVKGDFAVLYLGLISASLMMLSISALHAVYFENFAGFHKLFALAEPRNCCLASAWIHAVCNLLLAEAYQRSDLSVVYPVARGVGVAVTAASSQSLVGETLAMSAAVGVVLIILGVLLVGLSSELAKCMIREDTAQTKVAAMVVGAPHEASDEKVVNNGVASTRSSECHECSLAEEGQENCDGAEPVESEDASLTGFRQASVAGNAVGIASFLCSSRDLVRQVCWAFAIGACIGAYSLVDKRGVVALGAPPLAYISFMILIEVVCLLPYILSSSSRRDQARNAFRERKRYILLVGNGGALCYLVILFAMQWISVAIVCAVRETAVIFGLLFGVMLLGESCNLAKWGWSCSNSHRNACH